MFVFEFDLCYVNGGWWNMLRPRCSYGPFRIVGTHIRGKRVRNIDDGVRAVFGVFDLVNGVRLSTGFACSRRRAVSWKSTTANWCPEWVSTELPTSIISSNHPFFFAFFQSKYKSLLISERTTVDELIAILLNCYSSKETVERFSLYEVCTPFVPGFRVGGHELVFLGFQVSQAEEYQRKLHHDDMPLNVQCRWPPGSDYIFLLKRNPNYKPKKVSDDFQQSVCVWCVEFRVGGVP